MKIENIISKALRLTCVVFILFSAQSLAAQTYDDIAIDQQLNFHRLKINPAYIPNNRVAVGLLFGSWQLNVSSPLALNKMVAKNDEGEAMLQMNAMLSSMRSSPFMGNLNADLLSVGIKLKSGFYSLNYGIGTNVGINMRDLVGFIEEGNGNHLGDNVYKAGGLTADLTAYQQIDVGYANDMLLDKKLVLGGRLKFRAGIANFRFMMDNADIRTATDGSSIHINAQSHLYVCAPALIESVETAADGQMKEIRWAESVNPSNLLRFQNSGIGLDLGATYRPIDKLTVGVSVTYIGAIRWKTSPYVFEQRGEITFRGVDINAKDSEGSIDSTLFQFYRVEQPEGYSTPFNTAFRLQATYDVLPSLSGSASLVLRSMYGQPLPEFNLIGTYKRPKGTSSALGLRIVGGKLNIGFSQVLRMGPLQTYFALDDIMGLANSSKVGFRIGGYVVI